MVSRISPHSEQEVSSVGGGRDADDMKGSTSAGISG
jgi:hypothetical protein